MLQSEMKLVRTQLLLAKTNHRSTLNIIALVAAGGIVALLISYFFNKPVTHIPESLTAFIAENDQCVHNINVLTLKLELLTRQYNSNFDEILLLQIQMSSLQVKMGLFVDVANSVC